MKTPWEMEQLIWSGSHGGASIQNWAAKRTVRRRIYRSLAISLTLWAVLFIPVITMEISKNWVNDFARDYTRALVNYHGCQANSPAPHEEALGRRIQFEVIIGPPCDNIAGEFNALTKKWQERPWYVRLFTKGG